jgi:hypothetical protein
MPGFIASDGAEYLLTIDAPKIKAIRDELDGLDIIEFTTFETLARDPVALVDVLWILCREQAKQAGITSREFGEALVGDPIEDATKALIEAVADFFPARKRSLLLSLAKTTAETEATAMEAAQKRIDDPELGEEMRLAIEKQVNQTMQQLTSSSFAIDSPE